MNPLTSLVIVSLLFFCKNNFGVKYPTKVDMPLNKETKPVKGNYYLVLPKYWVVICGVFMVGVVGWSFFF